MLDKIAFKLNAQMRPLFGAVIQVHEGRPRMQGEESEFTYDIDINTDPGEPYKEFGDCGHVRLRFIQGGALCPADLFRFDEGGKCIYEN